MMSGLPEGKAGQMNFLKLPLTFLLSLSLLTSSIAGQHKRRAPEKPVAKPPAAPAPSPTPTPTPTPEPATFDTLLSGDCYKVYAEVRGVGQLVKSGAATDVLDPILKLGGPPKEFTEFVSWLKSHADELMTSRLLIAAWPTAKDVPDGIAAIEFASPEEAAKFETKLQSFLPSVIPPVTPASTPEPEKQPQPQPAANDKPAPPEKPKEPPAPVPGYNLQRSGALLILSDKPVQLKKLRPAHSKLLSEDVNFRVAYNRFTAEPIFVYIDLKAIEKESEERRKEMEEQQKKVEEEQKALREKQIAGGEQNPATADEVEVPEDVREMMAQSSAEASPEPSPEPSPEEPTAKQSAETQIAQVALSSLFYGLISAPPDMPDALGIGFSPENDSFDLRVLMIDSPGGTSDPLPILLQGLKFGPPIAPESPIVLPADSELALIMSLDFPRIQAGMSAPRPTFLAVNANQPGVPEALESPLATIEKQLKINIKDDVLPLLGSEIAVSFPLSTYDIIGPPHNGPRPQPKEDEKEPKPTPKTPFVVVSLRDKEGMRRLMPKLLEGFAGKAAVALAQTERREDTEIVSVANAFAYAFVGNFLVLGTEPASIRHVVDSYLKGETLNADPRFTNGVRWQPHVVQAQAYMSPAMMDGFKKWAKDPDTRLNEEASALLARLSTTADQPVTYSLSNDGLGELHEVHVPKSLVLLLVATIAVDENPPESVSNEKMAMVTLWSINSGQRQYRQKNKTCYASLEELVAGNMVAPGNLKNHGYKFEVKSTAEGFETTAVPTEYGKSGKLSFFMDQSGTIRGGDHHGAPATASDQPIRY